MPITFKSKHAANILMLESVALQLIKMMGHSGSVPSSLAADDMTRALEHLRRGLVATSKPASQAIDEDQQTTEQNDRVVSLGHRALPLIEMLESAIEHGDYVIWDR